MSSQRVLVDTDVLIDFLRKNARARQLLEEAVNTHVLCSSVVTLSEILAGMRPSESEATESLMAGLILFPVTEQIARTAGDLRRKISSKKILLADCLIAATAIKENCLLLTFNRRDYLTSGLGFYPV